MPRIERALLSVTDKTGIVEFARALTALGVEILSTGGTFRVLKEAGIAPLREVAEVTQFPEMLDGRVKTIHPRIAGGILAVRSKPEHMRAIAEHGIPRIDLVAVNLYEFEKVAAKKDASLEELIENIDIGGPTMIRAAAKNWQDVAVVTSIADYAGVIDELRAGGGSLSEETHWRLAKQAFATTAAYDRAVSARLAEIPPTGDALPATLDIRAPRTLGAALRRESAPVGGAVCDRQRRDRRRRAASRQGTFLQQSGRSRCGLAIGPGIRPARVGDHQTHQSVRLRRRFHTRRKLPPGIRGRSGIGVRRRAGVQP